MKLMLLPTKRTCFCCGSSETRIVPKSGAPQWYSNHDGSYLCDSCFRKIYPKHLRNLRPGFGKNKHKHECYACGTLNTRKWLRNNDIERNVLCEPCFTSICYNFIKMWHIIMQERNRLRLMELLDQHICIRCGIKDPRILVFEHKNNDGKTDRKRFTGNALVVYYLLHPEEAREKLQVMCANCNILKRYTEGDLAVTRARIGLL